MRLRFTKMQGLGNDFVVIDAIRQSLELSVEQVRFLADRRFGIGCDQVLVVEPGTPPEVDFGYRIFNADGGEVEQCGNGARCFLRFVRDQGLSDTREIRVRTNSGIITLTLEDNGEVTVEMGVPDFSPEHVPFLTSSNALVQTLDMDGSQLEITVLSMGNPHAVHVVKNVDATAVNEIGPRIERHPRFPQRVNAGFMELVGRHRIRLRVYERGAGETLACGTGACAAAVTGIARGLLDQPVRVETRGGELSVSWHGAGTPVRMTGPAFTVFEGEIELAD